MQSGSELTENLVYASSALGPHVIFSSVRVFSMHRGGLRISGAVSGLSVMDGMRWTPESLGAALVNAAETFQWVFPAGV